MTPPTVVKVGGSLLDCPELPARLGAFLDDRRGWPLVFLVGGGPAVDLVRNLDRVHRLGQERAHALALHALDFTAQALAALVPALVVIDRLDRIGAVWDDGRVPLLAPRRFLDEIDARRPDPLPAHWDVTSDSIAARIAEHLGARELIVLKSVAVPEGLTLAAAAGLGFVDPAFPSVAAPLDRVTFFNLRDPTHGAV